MTKFFSALIVSCFAFLGIAPFSSIVQSAPLIAPVSCDSHDNIAAYHGSAQGVATVAYHTQTMAGVFNDEMSCATADTLANNAGCLGGGIIMAFGSKSLDPVDPGHDP